jgi:hypothetical protein
LLRLSLLLRLPRGSSLTRLTRLTGLGSADLALHLVGQTLDFLPGNPEGFRLVPEDALGGVLHALPELPYALARLSLNLSRLAEEASLEELLCNVESLVRTVVSGPANRVVKLLGKEWLRFLCLLDSLLHPLEKVTQLALLLFDAFLDLFPLSLVAEGRSLGAVQIGKAFSKIFLVSVQLLRSGSHVSHLLLELTRRSAAKLVAEFLELALGAGAFRRGPGHLPFTEGFGSPTHVVPRLAELIACFCHAPLVIRFIHTLGQFVGIAKDPLLLIPQALELALNFLSLLFIASFCQRRLQFLQSLVQIGLPARQFAQTVEHPPVLLLG